MNAVTAAVLAAVTVGLSSIFMRRAVIAVPNAAIGVIVTVPPSALFFFLAVSLTGGLDEVLSLSWKTYVYLGTAGIIHFIIARRFNYLLVQLVGANLDNILRKFNPIITVSLGVAILGEELTWDLALGVILIACGLFITMLNPQMFKRGEKVFSGLPRKAYLYALIIGMSTGIDPILIKLGVSGEHAATPVGGVFISTLAATMVLVPNIFRKSQRTAMTSLSRGAIGFFLLAGLAGCLVQLFRFLALSLGNASVVAPIFSTSPIIVLLLSLAFNRRLEIFTPPVILGMMTTVGGSILVA